MKRWQTSFIVARHTGLHKGWKTCPDIQTCSLNCWLVAGLSLIWKSWPVATCSECSEAPKRSLIITAIANLNWKNGSSLFQPACKSIRCATTWLPKVCCPSMNGYPRPTYLPKPSHARVATASVKILPLLGACLSKYNCLRPANFKAPPRQFMTQYII